MNHKNLTHYFCEKQFNKQFNFAIMYLFIYFFFYETQCNFQ